MKPTYKVMHYIGPIHILRRWYQELLACNFSCIHRSHDTMQDVDYLSCIKKILIKDHLLICNQLSLADRALRPGAYDETVISSILAQGKYSSKQSLPQRSNPKAH